VLRVAPAARFIYCIFLENWEFRPRAPMASGQVVGYDQ